MRELYNQAKRHLLVDSDVLQKVLDAAFETLDAKEPKLNGYPLTIAAHYFDREVLQLLPQKQESGRSELLANLKRRLDLKFLVMETPKRIQERYHLLQEGFIKRLEEQAISLSSTKSTLVKVFQKEWENELIPLVLNNQNRLSIPATSYWYKYHLYLAPIQNKLEDFKRRLPNHLKDSYTNEFKQAFIEFIEHLKKDRNCIRKNSDAFVIDRLNKRILDRIRKLKKEGIVLIDPTNFEKEKEIREAINNLIAPTKAALFPLVYQSLQNLGEPCYSIVITHINGMPFREIGKERGYSKERAHQKYWKCIEEIRKTVAKF